jgi:hypothetical protein
MLKNRSLYQHYIIHIGLELICVTNIREVFRIRVFYGGICNVTWVSSASSGYFEIKCYSLLHRHF